MEEAWHAFADWFNGYNITFTPPIVASALAFGVVVLVCVKPLLPKR